MLHRTLNRLAAVVLLQLLAFPLMAATSSSSTSPSLSCSPYGNITVTITCSVPGTAFNTTMTCKRSNTGICNFYGSSTVSDTSRGTLLNSVQIVSSSWSNAFFSNHYVCAWNSVSPSTKECWTIGSVDPMQLTYFGKDQDMDKSLDATDNCPGVANSNQMNTDSDSQGDVCDTDDDNDGLADTSDNCPLIVNVNQLNTDGDTQGDACDPDDDNDGVADASDSFPLNPAESADADADGAGDNADPDDDNDGAPDTVDPEPLNPANSSTWPLNGGYHGSALRESQAVQ